jgi:hypothetical protein
LKPVQAHYLRVVVATFKGIVLIFISIICLAQFNKGIILKQIFLKPKNRFFEI